MSLQYQKQKEHNGKIAQVAVSHVYLANIPQKTIAKAIQKCKITLYNMEKE